MSLTPKNWKSFQHYKDRSPIWIKLHRSLLDDFEFHCLPVASRALAPMLWLLASEYQEGSITASNKEIAFRFRMSVDDLDKALSPLIDAGFFMSDEFASAPLAQSMRAACPETETETEGETEKNSRSKVRPKRAPKQIDLEEAIAAASDFEAFWQAYPRRDGPNPRKPAETKFSALVKSGCDPAIMIAAAKKLAADESARGNIGTRFIPQALTWLNQQRWADHAAVAMIAEMVPAEVMLEKAVAMFAKMGIWSKHAPGAEPGMGGCLASSELLAKYGLAADGRKLSALDGPLLKGVGNDEARTTETV